MADEGDDVVVEPIQPAVVEYEPATGMPPEYCEYLPKEEFMKSLKWLSENRSFEWLQANCSKFKKIFESEDVLAEKLKELSVSGEAKAAKDKPKLLPGGKVKKNAKPEIVLERSVRNKRKCITTVSGLDTFGIKLPEAAKLLGKKFACGSSVVKDAAGRDQIDVQGDFQFEIAELIMKKYKDKDIKEEHFYALEKARKSPLF